MAHILDIREIPKDELQTTSGGIIIDMFDRPHIPDEKSFDRVIVVYSEKEKILCKTVNIYGMMPLIRRSDMEEIPFVVIRTIKIRHAKTPSELLLEGWSLKPIKNSNQLSIKLNKLAFQVPIKGFLGELYDGDDSDIIKNLCIDKAIKSKI